MQNRFAEIECLTCGIEYKIKMRSEEYIPDEKFLFCPICGGKECKARWIDQNGSNN